jgi:4-hydroxybenzoyl-CoA thioesterase
LENAIWENAAMLVNTHEVEIEFGDCDPAGIVFYPNYFRMFDAATARLFEAALGMKKIAWTRRFGIVGIPMVDTSAKFIKPVRFGDVVRIESAVQAFRRSSFDVEHRLFNGGELAVEGRETRVWVGKDEADPHRLRSQPIPNEVIAAFSLVGQQVE